MLHHVRPGATGGPNVSFSRIEGSPFLRSKYDFVRLNQNRVAGGRINIGLIIELNRVIKGEKPDIIHISGLQSAGFHCMLAAVLAGCKKRIISIRGFSGDAIGLSLIKRFVFNYIAEPLSLVLATRVQGISKFTTQRKMVKKFAGNKTSYIYNFPPNWVEKEKKNFIRKELGIDKDEIVFTAVARIIIDKGFKELSEAILSLSEIKNIRFLIVGDGNYQEILEENMKNEIKSRKVIMMGKRDDVMDILSESNVFILPTLHENLGNVFLEASVVKIPSISTCVGGVPEIVIDGKTGILVPPYNVSLLSEAIIKLYENQKLREEMGLEAYKRINDSFNVQKIAEQFDELYTSVLKK